ncbi:ribosomal protein S17 [Apiospora rasikravindrae]|uniref:Ribosomal protein S17 n=1 Tax=Apiospora rasikravindrae TaxID=990691 RepID=A0ABR1TE36_9PEZI
MSATGPSRILEAAASGIGQAGRMYKGSKTGVVVSAGLMDKTVKVRLWGQRWEKHVSKSFKYPHYHLVHDPSNSVRQGDVISIAAGWRASSRKKHVVKHIIAPYGQPIDARPPVPTEEELKADYIADRVAKIERREAAAKERREAKQREQVEAEERRAQKLAKARQHQQEGTTTSIADVD